MQWLGCLNSSHWSSFTCDRDLLFTVIWSQKFIDHIGGLLQAYVDRREQVCIVMCSYNKMPNNDAIISHRAELASVVVVG